VAWDWKWDLDLRPGCAVYIVKTMVFEGFPDSGKVGICDNLGGFGTSF